MSIQWMVELNPPANGIILDFSISVDSLFINGGFGVDILFPDNPVAFTLRDNLLYPELG
jgi:hypothetical protein